MNRSERLIRLRVIPFRKNSKLQRTLNKTIVFVTHDMDEAIKLADRIVILKAGEIVQVGTPDEILRNPANEFVEEFIGKERLIQSRPDIERVEQMMNRTPVTVSADKTLSQAIQLMRENVLTRCSLWTGKTC